MFSEPQYTDNAVLCYNFHVPQKPVSANEIKPSFPAHVYEENGVLYCATQTENRLYWYVYCLNNPLKYTDPGGEFWGFVLKWFAASAGNYLFNVADNSINKGMPVKDAFKATPIIGGVNFTPFDISKQNNYGFSNPQVDAYNIVQYGYLLSNQLDKTIASFSGMGQQLKAWSSEHIFVETELRLDYGAQIQLQGKVWGTKAGLSVEKETEPLLQLNVGYNGSLSKNSVE